jgi:hypothetical protein
MLKCPNCHYDLAGLANSRTQGLCPECGQPIPQSTTTQPSSLKKRLVAFLVCQLPALAWGAWSCVSAVRNDGRYGFDTLAELLFVYPIVAVIGLVAGAIVFHTGPDNLLSTFGISALAMFFHIALIISAIVLLPIYGC